MGPRSWAGAAMVGWGRGWGAKRARRPKPRAVLPRRLCAAAAVLVAVGRAGLLLTLPAASAPLARSPEISSRVWRCRKSRWLGLRAVEQEKRIADDGIPYTKQEFIDWYRGSTVEWDRAKLYVPEPPPVPKTSKEEFAPASSPIGIMRFSVNASVGQFVRPVFVPETGLVLCIGDWSGDITGLDPASGTAKFTSVNCGLKSIHSFTHVPEAGLMLCGSAWTGNVSAFDPATGERRWAVDAGVGEYARSVHAKKAGLVVFGGGGTKSKISGVDPASGKVLYNVDTGIGAIWTLTYIPRSGAVLCGGSWTRPKKTGRVVCLDPTSGEQLFDVDPEVGRYVCAACSPDGELVFCGGDLGTVAALDPSTGDVRFSVNASVDDVWSLETTPNSIICIGGWSGMVSGLDPVSGDVRFVTNATIGKIFSSVYVPELGVELLGNDNGTIAGLDPNTGDIRFKMDAGIHDPGPWDPIKSNPWKNELWGLAYVPEAKLVYCGGDSNFTLRALAA